ncbi:MAG: adenylyl-sulfate kinase, partial [Thermoanaerobaculia bacterium]|nr:adenylyl-sulfate kinase [Thermoanaerobaculia bacterium]
GSGKSTVGHAVADSLVARGVHSYVLDGDNVRLGLNSDLGFSPEDRTENIRRVSEVAKLFADAGVVTVVAFISPYRDDRAQARETIGDRSFLEVFVDTPIELCEERDPKGLYRKARAGEIPEFTGVSAPYEAPESPEMTIRTAEVDVDQAAGQVIDELERRGFLPGGRG